ncbi:MAG: bifunctional helix-turn-helix transcriptional regulator/GNAT family N-acetyltransferase [Bacteroidetes bacterium]|nr:bifunctional helix-turn-helix transcriptional regulator/GNAT family N-acetyltransferase [Bacteroidota bacterium]
MNRNYIQELGIIAIASRLKQLTEVLTKDMAKVYSELHVDFEPRWFTFVHLLKKEGKLSLTEISRKLNQTHVAANQVANALEKAKLIETSRDRNDNRKRLLTLSTKGQQLVEELEPVWKGVENAVDGLLKEAGSNLFEEIEKIETGLLQKSIYERIRENVNAEIVSRVKIISYKPVYKHAFIDLNLRWLEKYFEVEPHDKKLLFNPDEEIIEKGGDILIATYLDEVIGTVAILKVSKRVGELTKMAVQENLQGHGIGHKLMESAILLARNKGYKKLTLLTSPRLEKAVNLYKNFGFSESHEPSLLLNNLDRSSIQMEIIL